MTEISGAVGAISSAATAAESVVTSAAAIAEGVSAGVVQAGAATAEGAVQTAGVAAEAAVEAIPTVAEAVPGVVNAGAEAAAQEGLASGAETALETSGPDAALNQLAETPTGIDTASPIPAQGAPLAEGGTPIGADTSQPGNKGLEGTDRTAEPSTGDVSADSGISEEIRDDPLFQQKLEEERAAVQKTGELIDEKELSQRALDKFNQDKQTEQSQLTPEQQRIQQLEQKINGLVAENVELKNNIAQINESLGEMKGVLTLLTQTMAEKEQDPKKKESLLVMLAKIAAIIVAGTVIEGGKTAAPPLSSPGR